MGTRVDMGRMVNAEANAVVQVFGPQDGSSSNKKEKDEIEACFEDGLNEA